MKNSYIIILAIVVLVASGAYFLLRDRNNAAPIADSIQINPVAIETNAQWKETTDPESKVSLSYPEELPTEYMRVVDWPPRVMKLADAYVCTEAGQMNARAGLTEERTIDGVKYCVTLSSEGAAGSIYEQYAYVFEKEGQLLSMTFSIRLPQCANYDDAQRLACENERTSFSIDELAHQIAQTILL